MLVHLRVGERALHAVLGAGPALVFSGNYGTVPLLQIEGGIELRARSGFYLLAVLQGVEPLVSSRDEIAAGRCVTGDCPSRFQPGLPCWARAWPAVTSSDRRGAKVGACRNPLRG